MDWKDLLLSFPLLSLTAPLIILPHVQYTSLTGLLAVSQIRQAYSHFLCTFCSLCLDSFLSNLQGSLLHFLQVNSDITVSETTSLSNPYVNLPCLFKITYCYQHIISDVIEIFSKRPNSKYFRLYKPQGLCSNYPTLPLLQESDHRQYINKWTWLCFNNNNLFAKRGRISICSS